MKRLFVCIALLALTAAAVGCGGSSDNKSSSNEAAKPSVAVTPSGTGQAAATPQTQAKAAKKEAAKAAKAVPAKVRHAVNKNLAVVKRARKETKSVISKLNAGQQITPLQRRLMKKVARGKTLTKAETKALEKESLQNARAVQKAVGKIVQPSEGNVKKGASKIPGVVKRYCQSRLRAVDGALSNNAKAAKLPSVLNTTIKRLTLLGSTSSPALTGVGADIPGMTRTQETTLAMRRVVTPAKRYAASKSAANRKKLSDALHILQATAKADKLDTCAIAIA